jgi:hypothetical protein
MYAFSTILSAFLEDKRIVGAIIMSWLSIVLLASYLFLLRVPYFQNWKHM